MSTAPKTGRHFIAWDNGACQLLFSAHWDKESEAFITEYERWKGPMTHWMPLPRPPKDRP